MNAVAPSCERLLSSLCTWVLALSEIRRLLLFPNAENLDRHVRAEVPMLYIRPNEIGTNGKYMEHITTSPPEKNLKPFEFLLRNMTSSVLCISHLPSVALKHVYDWAAMEREVIVARAVLSCPMMLHYPSIPVKGGTLLEVPCCSPHFWSVSTGLSSKPKFVNQPCAFRTSTVLSCQ